MATVITAPNEAPITGPSLFLAGGISGCPDWQESVIQMLRPQLDDDIVLINPRRKNFEASEAAAIAQIKWEFKRLRAASAILFWFPAETVCPITLFELGTMMRSRRPIYVGCHPEYRRMLDVVTQVNLYRPEVEIYDDLEELANEVVFD